MKTGYQKDHLEPGAEPGFNYRGGEEDNGHLTSQFLHIEEFFYGNII
jgi:hypothetical protein